MVPGKTYDVEKVGQLLWRRRWFIVLPFLALSLAAFVIARGLPDLYRSETVILVVPQRVSELYVRSTTTTRIEDRLRTINQQILSRTRLEQIIREFDLYDAHAKPVPMEALVERMRGDVDPEIVRADSFRLSFEYTDPVIAMKVTERLATLYIEENIRDREVAAEGTNQFLEQQLDDARSRLLEQEKKIEAYRLRHSGELPTQLPTNLQVIQNTQMQIQSVLESINRDRDRRSVVDRLIGDASIMDGVVEMPSSNGGETTGSGGSAASELAAATAQLTTLERRLTPEHPDVVRMRRLVGELEVRARAEAEQIRTAGDAVPRTPARNPAELARRNQMSALRAERETLDRQIAQRQQEEQRLRGTIADYQSRVEMVPTRESEMIGLTRDYDTLQASYRTLLSKKEESQIATNLERQQSGEQFKVLDPARLPETPFSPNRMLINLIGSIGGLLVGLLAVGVLEVRDTTLRTEEDVLVALDLPVLAIVPAVVVGSGWKGRRLLMSGLAAAALLGAIAFVMRTWFGR